MSEIYSCHYCQRELTPLEMTRDHVVPRARGGLDIRWNIVWSCRDDNSRKADSWPVCACSFCKRTKRRHWEQLRIKDTGPRKSRG